MEPKQQPPYPLRMTPELRAALESFAESTKRSLNAEIVERLEGSLSQNAMELLITQAKLETVRDSFQVVAQEATNQISVLTKANEVGRLAANSALENFDELAEITQELFDGDVRDIVALQVRFDSLKRSRQTIEEQMNRFDAPEMPTLGEVVRARGKEANSSIVAKVQANAKAAKRSVE